MPVAIAYLELAAPYVAAGALLISLISVAYAVALKVRLRRLALGPSGSMEESMAIITRELKELHEFRTELEKYLKLAESRLRGTVQGVGVVRFNPFASGNGGNQSFAAALLDERGCGVVFSTLYSRDRISMYAKPLAAGKSSFELSEEERQAIEKAKHQIAGNRV